MTLNNSIATENFEIDGQTYFALIGIENGKMVVKEIVKQMSAGPNGLGRPIYVRK